MLPKIYFCQVALALSKIDAKRKAFQREVICRAAHQRTIHIKQSSESWGRGISKVCKAFIQANLSAPTFENFWNGTLVKMPRNPADLVNDQVNDRLNSLQLTENERKVFLFIKESFSFQPKYVENKFLNLTLKFHQNKTIKDNNTTSIVPKNSLFQIQNLVVAAHHLKEVIVIIGNNNAINKNTK